MIAVICIALVLLACSVSLPVAAFLGSCDRTPKPQSNVVPWRKVAALLLTITAVGCRAQVPQSPPVKSCPAATATSTVYVPIQTASNALSGTTFLDTPGPSSNCYIVQSFRSSDGQVSVTSNVASATTGTGQAVNLSWTAPAEPGLKFIVSKTPAVIVAPPVAPSLNTPTVAENLSPVSPTAPAPVTLALNITMKAR